ncbi:ATPase inhibitor, mitochondrial isoform X2 [Pseudorca crassidens]|uniref:ATPase inhibitor, mitochondrial isoform X2 n=1 Tax=Pseudorca crassidens TaxID=82174 RepID=UPI00352C68AE
MAATALAARTRFGVWSVWAMQGRGFGSESADNLGSSAGAVRDAGGAFGKKEQAEEERYFRNWKHWKGTKSFRAGKGTKKYKEMYANTSHVGATRHNLSISRCHSTPGLPCWHTG